MAKKADEAASCSGVVSRVWCGRVVLLASQCMELCAVATVLSLGAWESDG